MRGKGSTTATSGGPNHLAFFDIIKYVLAIGPSAFSAQDRQPKEDGTTTARGRPKGEPTVAFPLRLRPDQKRDLELISEAIDGVPPLNGLIQLAVDRYVAAKLEDPVIRSAYERRLNPRLSMVKDSPKRA